MKSAIFVSAAVVASAAVSVTPEHETAFKSFVTKYNKKFTSDEYTHRLAVFAENIEKVTMQNRDHLLKGGDAVFGITKFSDLTPEEFKAQYLTYRPPATPAVRFTPKNGTAVDEVDWRKKGAVTEVKDQGQCGSCWAFSATEAIESYAFLAGQKLQKLSAQQITSCDKVDQGCNGGNTETAYKYVEQAGGLHTEDAYPYSSGTGDSGTCLQKPSGDPVVIKGFTSVEQGEANLKAALANGPVSVCLAADAFQSYSGGILKSCPGQIDHCVQAVGYSTSDNYWLVRNSWATEWGEDGYIRLAMGDNLCHVADDVTFPTF